MRGLSFSIGRTTRWLALLCAACVVLSTAVTWGVYDAIPHLEDEHAQWFQARVFAAGRVTAPLVQPRSAFSVPFTVVVDDHVFSKYPPGYALLLAVGMLVGQAWLVNVLAAVGGLLGVYYLGRDLFGEAEGLLAAGLGLAAPMSVMLSGTFLPHTSELALLTWFAWAFLRARRGLGHAAQRYALAAGLMGGLALAIRPLTAAAVGLPFALLGLVDVLRGPRRWWKVYVCVAGGFLLGVAVWPVYNWIASGNALVNTYQLYWPYDAVGFGPQFGRDGHTLLEGLNNIRVDLQSFEEMALGWPAWFQLPALWLVMGAGLLLPRRSRWEGFLVLPAAALVLAHAAYWTRSAGVYGPRYFAEAMPFIWLLAARGLLKLDGWTALRPARWVVRLLLPVWMAWSLAFLIYPHFEEARNLYEINRADAELIGAAHLQRALVFVEAREWTDYARLSWLNPAVLREGEVIFARDNGWSANVLVRTQFAGRAIYRFDRTADPPLVSCPTLASCFQRP